MQGIKKVCLSRQRYGRTWIGYPNFPFEMRGHRVHPSQPTMAGLAL